MNKALLSLLMTGLLMMGAAACSRFQPAPTAIDRLKPCPSSEGPTDAYCGKVDVWEDRAARSGRKLALKVVVLPALRRKPAPDPLFFLAGGPGQGAAKMARSVRDLFRSLQTDRDIVLVDQRGTGDSNPLDCKPRDDDDEKLEEDPAAGIERLRACLESYQSKADVRRYVTTIAMDDLDEVRQFLGYSKINLYGGSYGTRAAIVYTNRHAASVRSVVLDSVAPTDMRVPLYMARDGQRALALTLRDCENDPACRRRFPDLAGRLERLLARLGSQPQRVKLVHPRTGAEVEMNVRRLAISGILFAALYSPQTAALLPLLIERAEKNDFQGFFALGAIGDGAGGNMAQGMHFSVVCSEDAPRIEAGSIEREAAGAFMGAEMAEWRLKPCAFWPKGDVDPAYYDYTASDAPALILSGELDPVTPPEWGQKVAAHWKNARHIVVPGMGHGAVANGCVMRVLRDFLAQGAAGNLNVDCIQRVRRPPFFLGPSGPDPLAQVKQ